MTTGAMRLRLPVSTANRVAIGVSLLVPLIAVTGFWPTYLGPLANGTVEKPSIIHFHAAVYAGWVLLFVAQVFFASTGQIALHRKLGRIGIYYGWAIVAVGLLTAFTLFAERVGDGKLAEAQRSLLAPLTDMIVFPIFFGAALYFRRRPEIHKRLMLVATTALLVAAVARMPFLSGPISEPARQLVWFSPILLAMGYDFYARRLVHPVYAIGLATLYGLSFRGSLRESDAWLSLSSWLATLVG